MSSFYNSIHHSVSIHSIFTNSINLHIIYKEEERKRKHVVETTPLTIKLSKWYDIYQFIKQKNIFMLGNFLLYKMNWKRILNKSQSDHSDISHILTYFLCDGLGSTHKKWYWNPTGLSPSQRTVSFQFFFKCPTEFKIWSDQILSKQAWGQVNRTPWYKCLVYARNAITKCWVTSFRYYSQYLMQFHEQQFMYFHMIALLLVCNSYK